MRKKKGKQFFYLFIVVTTMSVLLATEGQKETLLAWWMVIVLLLPPLMWALKTPYIALKTLCSIAFINQFVTLPYFYLNPDNFQFGAIKPFGFTAIEAWPMLWKIMLFLVFLIIFFKILYRLKIYGGSSRYCSSKLHPAMSQYTLKEFFYAIKPHLKYSRYSWLYLVLIILLICIMAPLNVWMFSQGIGLVGVAPPKLPYRLSGILYYLMAYVVPLLLGLMYWKTKRGWIPALLLIGYAYLLGLSGISRSRLVFVMLPILSLAWLDRRRLLFSVASLGTLIGFALVTSARQFVYIVDFVANKTSASTSDGIVAILFKSFEDPNTPLRSPDFLLKIFVTIFNRLDGFQNLVMAQYYDSDAVMTPGGFLLRMIYRPLAPIDIDLHHIHWLGYTLPKGFYIGGGFFSNVVILGNNNVLWILACALLTASILVLVEKRSYRLFRRYNLPDEIATAVVIFLSLIFIMEIGGATSFVLPSLLLLGLSWSSKIFHFNSL